MGSEVLTCRCTLVQPDPYFEGMVKKESSKVCLDGEDAPDKKKWRERMKAWPENH